MRRGWLLFVLLAACSDARDVVRREPSPCERLCDWVYHPISLALPTSDKQCFCEYKDIRDEFTHDQFGNPLSQTGIAYINCKPNCEEAAKRVPK